MDTDLVRDREENETTSPSLGLALGRVEATNVVRTFLPFGMNDAERQAARRQRFAPY